MKSIFPKPIHRLLLAFVCLLFSINFISFCAFEINDYNQKVGYEQEEKAVRANGELPLYKISGFGISRAVKSKFIISVASFIAFLFLFSRKRFFPFLAFIMLLVPFGNFVLWLIGTQQGLMNAANPDAIIGTDRILYGADFINFLSFFLISVLLVWLLSISLRVFNLKRQRKNALP